MNLFQKNLFRSLFDQLPDPALILDIDFPHFTVLDSNIAFNRVIRSEASESSGLGFWDVFLPAHVIDKNDCILIDKGLSECLETGQPVKLPLIRLDLPGFNAETGDRIWWETEIRPLKDTGGRVEALVCTGKNMSEQVTAIDPGYRSSQWNEDLEKEQHLNNALALANAAMNASNEALNRSHDSLKILNEELEQRVSLRTGEFQAAQEEALIQRDRLNDFFMQAPAGICFLNGPTLVFELVNPLYQSIFPGRVLLGKPILEAIPELVGQPVCAILDSVFQTGQPYEGKELLIPMAKTDDGPVEERYFNFIYQARIADQKQVTGILVMAFEVTELVFAKRELEQSEKRFRTILNTLPQIAWTNTPVGEVNFFNKRYYDYTGLDNSLSLQDSWVKVIYADDLPIAAEAYKVINQGTSGGEFEARILSANGSYRWHLNRMQPILDKEDRVNLWIGTATDIEVLKGMQQEKDDFVSIASHELKTPITSLNMSIQLINEMKDSISPQLLSKLMGRATKSMDKLMLLVDDLLNVSRLNQGQLHLNKTWFRLDDLIKDCSRDVAFSGKFEIILEGAPDLKVYADAERIEQVLVNFINNAVKYAPDSKTIRIITEKLDHEIKVSVIDKGPGVSALKLPNLFDRYYRVDDNGSQYSGLGLGLYICAEIIEKHKGRIMAESEPGKGCIFWFTLPA